MGNNNNRHNESKLNIDVLIKIILPIVSVIISASWYVATLSMRVGSLEEYHKDISIDFVTKKDERIIEMRIEQLEHNLEKMHTEVDSLKMLLRRSE